MSRQAGLIERRILSRSGLITTLVADPPWQYENSYKSNGKGAAAHYPTMPLNEIRNFLTSTPFDEGRTIAQALAPDAHLWLWTTNGFLLEGAAKKVWEDWGFRHINMVTWCKGRLEIDLDKAKLPAGFLGMWSVRAVVKALREAITARHVHQIGPGHYLRGDTEQLVFCVRGSAKQLVQDRGVSTSFVAPKGRHSAKPEEAYRIIERVSPGPYLELFARQRRAGWDAIGNQL